jgi:hypothetical protein
MQIVQNRYKKYFTKEDGSLLPIIDDNSSTDLLKTIKLSKNIFK